MTASFDPALDLTVTRIIKAPRALVWRAWTTPKSLEQWWLPAPAKCQVATLDLRPGGAFKTRMSENGGAFVPHVTACFLAVDEEVLLVFTDTLKGGWRPGEQPFMTAVITLKDHPHGTDYTAHAMHRSEADRHKHEELGFYDGWGTVTEQLAALVERQAQNRSPSEVSARFQASFLTSEPFRQIVAPCTHLQEARHDDLATAHIWCLCRLSASGRRGRGDNP